MPDNGWVYYFLAIALMTIVTFLPRLLPILLLSRRRLPPYIQVWLSYIPVAVLAALLGPILFLPQGDFTFQLPQNLYFWAAIPTFIAALVSKNMFVTVLIGILSLACLRLFI